MLDRPESLPEPAPVAPRRRPRQRMRTPQEAREWRRRIIGYAVMGVSFVLVVNALVGENGYLATIRASKEKADVIKELRRTTEETERIKQQLHDLESNPSALEDAARRGQHLSKPGETMVVIKDGTKPADAKPAPGK